MTSASVEDRAILSPNKMTYRKVILPFLSQITLNDLQLLQITRKIPKRLMTSKFFELIRITSRVLRLTICSQAVNFDV
jgi:hypothetical protein